MAEVKVFMSYRRADNPFLAGRLKDELARVFGEPNIFFDVDSIHAGADFREVIRETLDSVDAVIALVGSDWEPTRLATGNDPVRTELREALQKQKLLIPVLVADTVMPQPDQLPAELETFAFLNAVRVRPDPDFENDADKLIHEIVRGVGHDAAVTAPVPVVATHESHRGGRSWITGRRVAVVLGGLVAAAILAFALASLDDDNGSTPSADTTTATEDGTTATASAVEPVNVIVNATQPWTDTGIDVGAGDRIQVTATGTVFHSDTASTDPNGLSGNPQLSGPLGSDNHSGLIGRITDTGAVFLVGANADLSADADGRLYLGINDVGLENNSGAFDADVTVTPD